MHFVCCNEKTQTNDKTKTLNLKHKKLAVRNQNKEMSFDMAIGVIFPLSQDSELGDKDLNNLVGVSKAKNTRKCTKRCNNAV